MNATETEQATTTTPAPARSTRAQLEAEVDTIDAPQLPKPKTITVLGVLTGASLVLSYLGSYAFTNAMLSAEMIKPWAEGNDPRPRWLLISFCSLMLVFMGIGGICRFLSRRQLQSIDATADATEEFRITDV
jgi:hypothetical protein